MVLNNTSQNVITNAQAEADGIRLKGIAKAEAMEAVGRAEAERMRLRAEAYSKYGDAAILNLILDTLPQIAAEVAAPLSKTKEIVIMNGSNGEPATLQSLTNLGKDFTTLVGTVPHAIRALTNVDLSQVRLFFILSLLFTFRFRNEIQLQHESALIRSACYGNPFCQFYVIRMFDYISYLMYTTNGETKRSNRCICLNDMKICLFIGLC
ncbi:flotillin [Schistosoma bovis]|uniref:Flotillin n=1 Tax=Schistosoma bovis TaxID=6184 RepID=A0A430QRU7_SCHBO|nr:flotillin [Schistosoma bovis]